MRFALAALAVAAVATVAAGCGGGRQGVAPSTSIHHFHGCRLSAKQHRDIAAARREIALMHKLEQPLKTVHETGPPKLEHAVNRFLLDVGPLPPDVKGRLMNLGKAATGLCHDCFDAIESAEPTVQTRLGGNQCTGR